MHNPYGQPHAGLKLPLSIVALRPGAAILDMLRTVKLHQAVLKFGQNILAGVVSVVITKNINEVAAANMAHKGIRVAANNGSLGRHDQSRNARCRF